MQNESTSKGKEVSQRRFVSVMERMTFFGARNQHGQTPRCPETGQEDLLVGADRWSTAKITSRTRRSSDITGLGDFSSTIGPPAAPPVVSPSLPSRLCLFSGSCSLTFPPAVPAAMGTPLGALWENRSGPGLTL
ncbi:unnamed protein product [Arctogadus glacialis]